GGSSSEIYRLRRTAETRCALEADAVITTSETMRGELTRRGLDAECGAVVPQVGDLEAYSPRPRPAELARPHGIHAALLSGSISSLLDYEGIDLLLRALALARAEREDLAVLVVGEGPARPSLEDLARELGIEDAVTFTGRIDHARIPDHYALLDVFALPRRDLEVCRTVT